MILVLIRFEPKKIVEFFLRKKLLSPGFLKDLATFSLEEQIII